MGKLYALYVAEFGELVNEKMIQADVVMNSSRIIKDEHGLFNSYNESGGCTRASHGNCETHVGLSSLPLSKDSVDNYGKPKGWCWSCWKDCQIAQLQKTLCRYAKGDAKDNFFDDFFGELMGRTSVIAAAKSKNTQDKISASEALFGFMGWLTTRDKAVTFSGHHNAGVAAELVASFCEVNNLAEPRREWDKHLVHPSECRPDGEPIVMGGITEEDRPPSSWQPHLEQVLSKLSGDLNQDNVSAAKQMLKELDNHVIS